MPGDRSWMQMSRSSDEYKAGVKEFMEEAKLHVNEEGKTRCPCVNCLNAYWFIPRIVESHLLQRGIRKNYPTWIMHGENYPVDDVELNDDRNTNLESEEIDDMIPALHDVINAQNMEEDDNNEDEIMAEQTFNEGKGKFDNLFDWVEQELYDGCNKFSALTFLVKLMHIKVLNRWTNKSFDMLLALLIEAFPTGTRIPTSHYETKKILQELGLGYETIHVCKYDCALFWKENEKLNNCPVCHTPRYRDNKGKGKKVPHRVLRFFRLRYRLQRLYSSRHNSKDMRWHHDKRPSRDGVLIHPADAAEWKNLDQEYPTFASEPRNVRLGLASDGFNPFGNMSTSYSIWPVVLTTYNMPPWNCMKETSFMLTLLIPGPKGPGRDMDVFLRPLVDELKELWIGVETVDVLDGKTFNMRAALLWSVSDFPAYANLSGWSTKGHLACPPCNKETCFEGLRSKTCYVGHQGFLPLNHKYRKTKQYGGRYKDRRAPKRLTGDEILAQLEKVEYRKPGKHPNNEDKDRKRTSEELNWTKRSIFFELEYWPKLKLRHNLDVMHIEKNICDNIVGTVLNIEGKTKDTTKARLDLADLNMRSELHLQFEGDSVLKPHASYTLTKDERKQFCAWLKSVRFPDGYAANISKNVNEIDGKISGLKTHDCHILLQQLLPIGIRPFLEKSECAALIELSQFFQKLCSKTLLVDDLQVLQKEIVVILCKLELVFPPAFFDVMVHLAVHLPYEAILAGPVHYRWMYPFERVLRTYKNYVRNKARPEGSIAEAYIVNEALTFCSMYFDGIETRFNHRERNSSVGDEYDQEKDLSIFTNCCRPFGKKKFEKDFRAEYYEKAHWYVINNCPEVQPYLEQHRKELELTGSQNIDQVQQKSFPTWFKNHMINLRKMGSPEPTDELYALANFPDRRIHSYPGCTVNGVKFLNKGRDDKRATQNSGICVRSSHRGHEMDFYGVLLNVYELRYNKGCRAILFECKWFDIDQRRKRIKRENNIVSINTGFEWYKTEPFILATQARQVYYLDDLKNRSTWKVVYKVNHRHLWDVPTREDGVDEFTRNEVVNEGIYQESHSSDTQFTCEQPDIESQSLDQVDVDPEIVHVDPVERQKRVAAEEAFNFICDDGEEDEVLEDYESEEKITSDEDSDLEYHMQGDPDDVD